MIINNLSISLVYAALILNHFTLSILLKTIAVSRFFYLLFTSIFYFIPAQLLHAQLQFFPIPQSSSHKIIRKKLTEDTVFNTLPFFEDFAQPEIFPDPSKWQIDETTPFVNSGFGLTPPSIFMATFDGATSNGTRYDEDNLFSAGEADNLTSVFFDLSEFQPSDSLYFSFYWQAQGLGEKPSENDFLRLQFRDREGNWISFWENAGDTTTLIFPFEKETIALTDTAAFHPYFAFRFQNTGRLSGAFDHWNLDYITFFQKGQRIDNDLAISDQATSLLKNYFAMPIKQFRQEELADTVYSSIQNNSNNLLIFAPKLQVKDLYTEDIKANIRVEALGDLSFTPGDTTFVITQQENMQLIGLQNNPDYDVENADSLALEYTFYFDKIQAEGLYVNDTLVDSFTNTFHNDTLRSIVRLEDYYAYDDGIAEYVVGIYQNFGQVAYRFVLNEPDYITAVDMYFPQIADDLNGKSFNLLVWDKIDFENTENDEIASRLSVPFVYPDTLNEFRRLTLSSPVYVEDTFYVGYEQLTDEPLLVGWDKNTNSAENIFFNVNAAWDQNTEYTGSMMIRPVFDREDPINSIEEDLEVLRQIIVYPNPSRDFIHLEGNADQYLLTDITGKILQQGRLLESKTIHTITLNPHLSGLYILVLQKQQSRISKKIFIE